MNLPADDFILLSLVNTKLRDCYSTLSALCDEESVSKEEIIARLSALGYIYDENKNAFIPV